jgi:urate oxidase
VTELGANRYGKSAIRLVKVVRGPDRHDVRDLTVAIALEGEFAASYVDGDNTNVVATDTMKNTVYALAGEHLTGPIEAFGMVLADHFLEVDQVDRAIVTIDEHRWAPIGNAPDAFRRDRSFTRTAVVDARREATTIEAGIADLTVMKTSKSAFSGFPRDEFTTLPDTDDRLLATRVTASWRYDSGGIELPWDIDASFAAISGTLLEVFAEHESPSVQATIWIIGRAIIERHPEVSEVSLTMPNLHHWLADLSRFDIPNELEIFIPTTEPYGLIQATVRRGD